MLLSKNAWRFLCPPLEQSPTRIANRAKRKRKYRLGTRFFSRHRNIPNELRALGNGSRRNLAIWKESKIIGFLNGSQSFSRESSLPVSQMTCLVGLNR